MDIGAVDRSGTSGTSWLHRASPKAKLLAMAFVLAAAIVTWNFLVLAALIIALVAAAWSARLDMRLAWTLALYPAFFAAIFAFASAPTWLVGLVIVLKAVTAAFAVVTVVLTTPYPQLFAPIQRIAPGLVGDALLMTYRTFFLLLERFGDVVRSIRLRAGIGRSPARAARMFASALGNLLLYAVDLAQREYDILWLRGYTGRLRVPLPRRRWSIAEVALSVAACGALFAAVIWRVRSAALNPFSWLVPIPALIALGVAAITRRRTT